MNPLREAAQQALGFVTSEAWGTTPYMDVRVYEDAARLRDVLQAALAQQAEPVEPVAWMFELARNFNLEGYGGWEKRITEYRPNTPEGSVRNVTPLYTAPPQRKLVPLTEEEIMHIGMTHQSLRQVVRAVELAHGIKEN